MVERSPITILPEKKGIEIKVGRTRNNLINQVNVNHINDLINLNLDGRIIKKKTTEWIRNKDKIRDEIFLKFVTVKNFVKVNRRNNGIINPETTLSGSRLGP